MKTHEDHHSYVRRKWSKEFGRLEKKRGDVTSRALTQEELDILLSLRWRGEPVYESAETFYSEDFKQLRKLRSATTTKQQVEQLLAMKDDQGKPVYHREELVDVDGEYKPLTEQQALDLLGMETLQRYRPATTQEACVLHDDIHSGRLKESSR